MKLNRLVVSVVSLIMLGVPLLGAAQPGRGPAAGAGAGPAAGPCAADIETFCKDVQPGGGRVATCLKQHEAELSAACKAHQEAVRKDLGRLHQACQGDVDRLCGDVKPGQGRMARCMRQHGDAVSTECRAAMKQTQTQRQQKQQPQKQQQPQAK